MPLWKIHTGWRYQFRYHGRKYSKSGYATKAEAAAEEAEHRKRLKSPQTSGPEPKQLTFLDLATPYLEWGQRRYATKTLKYKSYIYRLFLEFAGNPSVNQITTLLVENFFKARPTACGYNRARKELGALFSWCAKRNLIAVNPCTITEKIPETKTNRIVPTTEEVSRIFLAAGPDRPLLLVLYYTLARIDEVLRLRWEDVNFSERWVRLWTRKRKDGSWQSDLIPMGQDLHDTLWSLWRKRRAGEWVFTNPQNGSRYQSRPKLMRGICQRAGVRPFGFHCIRHYGATQLADQGETSVSTISHLLRHQNKRTTEIYLGRVDSSLREAAERIPAPGSMGNVLNARTQGSISPNGESG